MTWHTVFISHSTKTDDAQAYLDAILDALRESKITPLLDQEGLGAGDYWREKLYIWMAKAHGAVLLLTEEALDSEFVPIEASVLAWRSRLQPDFVFVPVLVGNVTREDLKKGVLGKLYLEEIQMAAGDDPQTVAAKVVEAFRNRKLIRRPRPRTLCQRLEEDIVKYMEDANLRERDVCEVGDQFLGWLDSPPPDDLTQFDDLTLFEKFARDLLEQDALTIHRVLRELKTRYRMTYAAEILDIAAPFWVSEVACKPLAQLSFDVYLDKRALSLNGTDCWTAHSYISRSFYRRYKHDYPVCVIQRPSLPDTLEDIWQQVTTFVTHRKAVGPNDPESIKKFIEGHEKVNSPFFFLFLWVPDPPLLQELRTYFKTATFFILSNADAESVDKLQALGDSVYRMEDLDGQTEVAAMTQYSVIESLLKRREQGA